MARSLDSPLLRLGAYAAALAAVAAAAAGVGSAVGPLDEGAPAAGGHGMEEAGAEMSGLAVSHDGYTLDLAGTSLPVGEARPVSFRIRDDSGRTVRGFDLEGGVRMHLILVRRDLTGYRHLHPKLGRDGSFRVDVTLPDAGVWRAFADFEREGERTVLADDLFAAGDFRPAPLPEPRTAAVADGYEVQLEGSPRAGVETELSFRVARGGTPAEPEPYLGARGHLVALRAGDLAYLHVHPLEEGAPGEIAFEATFPTAGRYRLFLQFADRGAVHTVPFTVEVGR